MPGGVGQGRRQQAALQRGDEVAQPLAVAVGGLPGAQQFLFVGAAVAGVEDGGADQERRPSSAGLHARGDQHRQPGAVGRAQLQRDPADLALHLQQRREVGLVVDPAADGEQVG